MDSNTDRTEPRTHPRYHDDDSSINSAIQEILPENIPNTIITKAPEERFRLGYWSVIALVVNRVIGLSSNSTSHVKLIGYYRHWYLQFSIDGYARNEQCGHHTSFLARRGCIYNCWCSFEY
jgi:hypothetical protein